MKKLLIIPLLLILLLVMATNRVVQAANPQPNAVPGIVSAPLANVHEEPIAKSHLATQVLMGDEVAVLDRQDNKYLITIPNQGGREGWVQQEAVMIPRDKGRSWSNNKHQWIVVTSAKTEAVILDPTGDHKVALYAGTRLPLADPYGAAKNLKVRFPDHSVAVISAQDIMLQKTTDAVMNDTRPEDIAATARKFDHVRFLAGGITSQGMDTDGLIHISYRVHGYSIGTDGSSLASAGMRVSKQDLAPGDVLFFYGENRGLYLGNGRFISIPRKGSAQVSGILDRRFAHALQYGVRIVGAGPEEHKPMAAMTADDILLSQARVSQMPLGRRIAYWAGRFIGTPYDTDPLGLYVRKNRIVTDERADCMYHVFRSVELAETTSPADAVNKALDLRFLSAGRIRDGIVVNYDDRFQYGEDMVTSGKWGANITAELGPVKTIPGSRGKDTVDILPRTSLASHALQKKLQDGDIIYWVKDPRKRVVEEIVAHLSVVHLKAGKVFIIHASGDKDRPDKPGNGVVKEVSLSDYVRTMRFVGAFVTRISQ